MEKIGICNYIWVFVYVYLRKDDGTYLLIVIQVFPTFLDFMKLITAYPSYYVMNCIILPILWNALQPFLYYGMCHSLSLMVWNESQPLSHTVECVTGFPSNRLIKQSIAGSAR